MPADAFIPLIDLATWFDGSGHDRAVLAQTVDEHLQRCGFLVVVNHGIDDRVFADTRAACREFFHLPTEAKEILVPPDGGLYRGWIGPGRESNAATYGIDTPPDLKETYAYGTVDLVDESLRTEIPEWYGPNFWPDEPVGFRESAEAFWRAGKTLAEEILRLFAVALGLPPDTIVDQCRATTSTGTLNWYHPYSHAPPEPGQYRIGPHTDFGTVTILDREPGIGGLQVLDDDGDWIDAPVVDGGLIVNTGDMLRQWTNDRWCSNEHRVLPPSADAPDEELISLVFFHEPDATALIAPFETCVSADNPARYEPIRSMDYLGQKFAALEVG